MEHDPKNGYIRYPVAIAGFLAALSLTLAVSAFVMDSHKALLVIEIKHLSERLVAQADRDAAIAARLRVLESNALGMPRADYQPDE